MIDKWSNRSNKILIQFPFFQRQTHTGHILWLWLWSIEIEKTRKNQNPKFATLSESSSLNSSNESTFSGSSCSMQTLDPGGKYSTSHTSKSEPNISMNYKIWIPTYHTIRTKRCQHLFSMHLEFTTPLLIGKIFSIPKIKL